MHYAFPFLPIEVQASIKELAALGMPESAVDLLIERTSKALEAKTTSLQMDIERIEKSIERRVDRIGVKLRGDLQIQHGASNQMLSDIHGVMQQQEAVTRQLRADFQDFGESVSGRIGGLEDRMDASEGDRKALHDQNDRLEKKFDKLEKDMRQALDRALGPDRVAELVAMIERHEKILVSSGHGGVNG